MRKVVCACKNSSAHISFFFLNVCDSVRALRAGTCEFTCAHKKEYV